MTTPLEFGISLTGHRPLAEEAALAAHAEANGFSHVWAWDNQILGQDAYVLLTLAATQTTTARLGTCVTNPLTRDPSVIASAFATLDKLTGGRMICGIGRGDSAVRMSTGRPSNLAALRDAIDVIRTLAAGRPAVLGGAPTSLTWSDGRELPVYVAAYGPKALALAGAVADGVILQLADPAIVAWSLEHVRAGAEAAGRDPLAVKVQCAAPMILTDDVTAACDEARWFGAVVGNHVADLVKNHSPADLPEDLTRFVAGRTEYDYRDHTKPGSTQADYVPDEIVQRFCVLGPAERCVQRLRELHDIGVTEFNVYAKVPDTFALVSGIGADVVPAFGGVVEAAR